MILLIGFLTFVMVMTCLFLMLLILIQLPKKEAGAGIAFGGAATDALFGAGSGNALTKLTKYTSSLFVILCVVLSVLNAQEAHKSSRRLEQELSKQANTPAPVVPSLSLSNQAAPPAITPAPAQSAPASNTITIPLSNTPEPAAPAAATPAPVAPTPAEDTPATPAPAPAP